jgi:hypothetical protein
MKSTVKACVLASIVLVAACAGTDFSYDAARKVQLGMSEDQVAVDVHTLFGRVTSRWPDVGLESC